MAMHRASAARLVLVTAGNEERAARIAHALVEERLAACVNLIGPVRSIYRWREAIEDEREVLMIIKTRKALYPRLELRIRELHGYEVPEIVALAPDAADQPYLAWLMHSTAVQAPRRRRRG